MTDSTTDMTIVAEAPATRSMYGPAVNACLEAPGQWMRVAVTSDREEAQRLATGVRNTGRRRGGTWEVVTGPLVKTGRGDYVRAVDVDEHREPDAIGVYARYTPGTSDPKATKAPRAKRRASTSA